MEPLDIDAAKLRRVVACLDGSELGERAVPHALVIAEALSAPVTLLRVLEQAPADHGLPDPLEWDLRRKEARDYLSRLAESGGAAAPGTAVDACVIEGKPADEICRFGADHEADLTVATTHGVGGPSAWALASTARKLLDRAPGSLLIVPAHTPHAPAKPRYRSVIVPLDGSAEAETALPIAARIAHAHGADLVLCHVVPSAELTQIGPLDAEDLELIERVRARNERVARLYLDRVRARLGDDTLKLRVVLLHGGDVAGRLSHAAAVEQADLVVMAAHGRNPRRSSPCGSATAELIARSKIPLLIVRPHSARAMRRVASTEARPPQLAAS